MYVRLARESITRQRRLYYLTESVAALIVMLVYALSALTDYKPILQSAAKILDSSSLVPAFLNLALVVILLFSVTFLIYLNTLRMQRRTRELGLYRLMGLTRAQLTGSLIVESLMVGAVTVVAGIALGILVSKLFAMILVRMLHLHLSVGLLVSGRAIRDVVVIFGILYLAQGALNAIFVNNTSLLNLIRKISHADQALRVRRRDYWLAGFSVILIGFSYWALLNMMDLLLRNNVMIGLLGVALAAMALGTYWFFTSGIRVALNWLRHFPKLYWQNGQMIVLANIAKRIRVNMHSLWLTTMLSMATITVLGSAAMMYQAGQAEVAFSLPAAVVANGRGIKPVNQTLDKLAITPLNQVAIEGKIVTGKVTLVNRGNLTEHNRHAYTVMSLSAYQRARKVEPQLDDLQLHGKETALILYDRSTYKSNKGPRHRNWGPLKIMPNQMNLKVKYLIDRYPLGGYNYFERAMIVSDRVYAQLEGQKDHLALYDFATNKDRTAVTKALTPIANQDDMQDFMYQNKHDLFYFTQNTRATDLYSSRESIGLLLPERRQADALFGFLLFLMLLIGVVFMLATGSILMLKQLAIAQTEVDSIQTLKRLGMQTKAVQHMVYRQTLIIFSLPLIVGSLHSLLLLHFLSDALDNPATWLGIVVSGIYVLVYAGFYLITARAVNRMVNQPLKRLAVF
ncbi:FtsX-like permease family protein [Lacticaseibacillus saniviri]